MSCLSKYLLLCCLLQVSYALQSQDYIVKRDSTKIETIVLEIKQNEIVYRLYSYQDGPIIYIQKSEVAYVLYKNGTKDIFISAPQETVSKINETDISQKLEIKPKKKENYKTTIVAHLGLVTNKSFTNVAKQKESMGHLASEDYNEINKKQLFSFQIGANLLIGKSPCVKFVGGFNYLLSRGEFQYSYSSVNAIGNNAHVTQSYYHVNSTVHFINMLSGPRFTIKQKFHIDQLIGFNLAIKNSEKTTGYSTSYDSFYNGPNTSYTIANKDTLFYFNQLQKGKAGNIFTVSFMPRIAYDFKVKQSQFGIYVASNFAIDYRLQWNTIGFLYYPLNKKN